MKETIEINYERNFDTLFLDSVNLLFESLDTDMTDWEFRQTLARGSILFSILLLEAAANTCIETLNLEGSMFNEIDKLPVIAKFDFFLRTNFRNKKLDRGITEVQGIQELKKLRDDFVHMKSHKTETRRIGRTGTTTFNTTPLLEIAKNPVAWDDEAATRAMRAVHSFLCYFFRKKCNYGPSKVTSILFSESKLPGDDNYGIPVLHKATRRNLLELGIDIKYMKFTWRD
jgi:hypothetical protein